MSKVTKFLSIGVDILQGLPLSEFDDPRADFVKNRVHIYPERLEKALLAAEVYFSKQGVSFEEPKTPETGSVKVTSFSKGKPILSEVRFYPEQDGETLEDGYEETRRIDVLRYVTGEDGVLKVSVPAGRYLVKVSKGSEYEPCFSQVLVMAGQSSEITADINHFVDLSAMGFYAGDIHHHSIYSSPVHGGTDDVVESPREVADSMRAQGLKFGALSDHHNIFNHKEWKSCKSEDFHPIPSKEISTSNGHVLSLGVDEYDVIYKIPEPKDRSECYLRQEFVRITDEIRERGGLPQLNHPRDRQVSISWNKDFYDMTGIFETMEIWNGSNPMYYGTTDALAGDFWRMLLEKGQYIPATTGSDCHNTKCNDYHKLAYRLNVLNECLKKTSDIEELKEYKRETDAFRFICDKLLTKLDVWAQTTLTSGCVRTYVKVEGTPDTEKLLDGYRKGHSFLTNGPILMLEINGKTMGETITESGKADIKVTLKSVRALSKVIVYTSKNRAKEYVLKTLPKAPSYDYSFVIEDYDLSDTDYVFLVASGDIGALAITNPIIVKHD